MNSAGHPNSHTENIMRCAAATALLAVMVLLAAAALPRQETGGPTPVGTITAYAGPADEGARARLRETGWRICDGAELLRSEHPALFEAIGLAYTPTDHGETFRLPDLRGRFLRALDDPDGPSGPLPPAGRDPDGAARSIGSLQHHATALPRERFSTGTESLRHTHDIVTDARGLGGPQGEDRLDRRGAGGRAEVLVRANDQSHTHNVTSGGDPETRPINVAVNWIIRTK